MLSVTRLVFIGGQDVSHKSCREEDARCVQHIRTSFGFEIMSYRARLVAVRLHILKRDSAQHREPISVASISLRFKMRPVFLKISIIPRTAAPILSDVTFRTCAICKLWFRNVKDLTGNGHDRYASRISGLVA